MSQRLEEEGHPAAPARSVPWTSPLTLGVETSCDDTACALVDGAGRVLSSVVSSQLEVHAPYGGVVPELASREHLSNWPPVLETALAAAGVQLAEVEQVAATRGPGLVGSLLVGLHLGKALAYGLEVPFRAVHHLEGHLFSPFLRVDGKRARDIPREFVGLVVSGGHTSLVRVEDGAIEGVGETRDDAMGEALDKLGKRLGLPFPGGPHVDRLAEQTEEALGVRFERRSQLTLFKVPRCGDSFDVSYSGLKSQAMRAIEDLEEQGALRAEVPATSEEVSLGAATLRLIAEFRAAAVLQLVDRLDRLYESQAFSALAVSGGVAACRALRRLLQQWSEKRGVELFLVDLRYCGDNAAMIAYAATALGGNSTPVTRALSSDWQATAKSRLPLGSDF